MQKKGKVILAVIALLVLCGLLYWVTRPQDKGLTATGTVEATRYDVTAKVPGYVRELTLQAGDTLNEGDLVCRIDREDLRAQVLAAKAGLAAARARLADLESGARPAEISAAQAQVASAQAQANKASADFARYRKLYDQDAISAQQLDAARTQAEVAQQALTAAQDQLTIVQDGARSGQVEAARAEVERLQAQVDAQQAQADGIDVESPASGTVLSKNFENNEFAPAGVPIVTVGDLDNCYVRVYVPSEDLARIQVGQAVKVYVDAYPGRAIAGTIQEISQQAEYTPRQSITARERANLVFAVKVAVQNQERIVKPGMPADVDFE